METKTTGLKLLDVLGILFVTLKLTKVVDWSWWWVLSPWWIGLVATLGLIILASIIKSSRGI